MEKITKNQTKEQFTNNILNNAKIDYKHFLKLSTKKDFINFANNIKFKTNNNNQIEIVYINKDILKDAKNYIYFDASKISNNQLKDIIIKAFIASINSGLYKLEQTKEQTTYSWSDNSSVYKFFKTLNLAVYFNDKVVEYNRVTKQYQTRNITK